MPRPGPRTTYKCSNPFKATAVSLCQLRAVSVQEVADSLYIHPFMLSRWREEARRGAKRREEARRGAKRREEAREGRVVTKGVQIDKDVATELKQLRKVKREHERLKVEYDFLENTSSSLPNESRHLCLHRALPSAVPDPADVPAVCVFILS